MDNDIKHTVDSLITRYLMGNASTGEIEELRHWIESDEQHKRYFQRQQDIWAVLNPTIDINDIDAENAELKVLRKAGIASSRLAIFKKLLGYWSRIAAVVILPLLAVVGYLIYRPLEERDIADATISTSFGCLSRTVLPDGTTVWLNANSSLQYDPMMDDNVRNVILHGEAYFDVKADAKHPFNVKTPYMTVTATGTEFNVNAYDSSASVTLVDGKVSVEVESKTMTLNPGEHMAVADGRPTISNHINTEKYCCWRNGTLIFEDEPLFNICNRLQQIYDVEFDIAPELKERTFRMILNGENISEVVRFFELAAPVTCEFENLKSPDDTTKFKSRIRIMPA